MNVEDHLVEDVKVIQVVFLIEILLVILLVIQWYRNKHSIETT